MLRLLAFLAACLLFAWRAQAAPHLPARGDTVLVQLPRRADPTQRELQALREQLRATPGNLDLATRTARRLIEQGRTEADPRYYGYAQAALAPWWNMAAPPPSVRLLRATLLQATHRFDAALADLEAVVAAEPANAQAWLTRATVETVRGDVDAATSSCARVSNLASELATVTCIANVTALGPRAAQSEKLLELVLTRSGEQEPQTRVWSLTLLAEMAAHRGDAAVAEQRFRRALAMTPDDSYLIGAYADFLLDQRRAADADALTRPHLRIDALLLRHALALQQLHDPALTQADAQLRDRFAAAALRGDSVHLREQARYELALHGDAGKALALALQNWTVQKEVADLRILLEAATAARDARAAAPALSWARSRHVGDIAIVRLTRQLEGGA